MAWPKKVLYFDCETTGLDPVKNGIVQLACVTEVEGKEVDELNLTIRPFDSDEIDPKALEIHGYTKEQMDEFTPPLEAHATLRNYLGKHCDAFKKADKYYPAGYNARFDLDFLAQWFKKCSDVYFGSWQNWRALDPLPHLYMLDALGILSLPNYKLGTVCEHYGIELEAHDALSDVRAARRLVHMILKGIQEFPT